MSPEEENRSIPLTSVAQLYSTVKGSSSSVFTKQRIPLSTQTKLSTVDGIEVVTKDCFVHRFGVQFVNGSERLGPPSGRRGRRSNTKDTPLKKLIATLVRHSQPSTRTNFFAFDYAPEGRVTPGILDTEITNFKAKEHAVLDMVGLNFPLVNPAKYSLSMIAFAGDDAVWNQGRRSVAYCPELTICNLLDIPGSRRLA